MMRPRAQPSDTSGVAVALSIILGAAIQSACNPPAALRPQPVSNPEGDWALDLELSDEFTGGELDTAKWESEGFPTVMQVDYVRVWKKVDTVANGQEN